MGRPERPSVKALVVAALVVVVPVGTAEVSAPPAVGAEVSGQRGAAEVWTVGAAEV